MVVESANLVPILVVAWSARFKSFSAKPPQSRSKGSGSEGLFSILLTKLKGFVYVQHFRAASDTEQVGCAGTPGTVSLLHPAWRSVGAGAALWIRPTDGPFCKSLPVPRRGA